MKRVRIDRLELRLKGVDALTAEAAARRLGATLVGRLASSPSLGEPLQTRGAVRPPGRADADELSHRIAERVEAQVRARLASARPAKKIAE